MRSPQTLSEADRRIVAAWAADCAERVLALFESEAPGDRRPRDAIARTRVFARGELDVAEEIRRRFIGHGAARDVSAPAAAAARAAGQAASIPHIGRPPRTRCRSDADTWPAFDMRVPRAKQEHTAARPARVACKLEFGSERIGTVTDPLCERDQLDAGLELAARIARSYVEGIGDKRVLNPDTEAAIGRWSDSMPEEGTGTLSALTELGDRARLAATRSSGPRFFHFGWAAGLPRLSARTG